MSSNVIILGANGQLGSDLVKVLGLNSNLNIIKITRNELDAILHTNQIKVKLEQYNADVIINCIATTNVDWCEENSLMAWQINSDFVLRLAQFCNQKQITLIHLSTDYVFDGFNQLAYQEFDMAQPQNIYGLSKYAGELALDAYHDKYFIFRVSGLFGINGASGKGGNFITTMQKLATTKDELKIIVDQVSNPTSTLAVSRCIAFFIHERIEEYGLYHCVSQNSCSWYDFAREILRLSNLDVSKIKPIEFIDYTFRANRPQNSVLSTDKLAQYFNMPLWEDSLSEYFSL